MRSWATTRVAPTYRLRSAGPCLLFRFDSTFKIDFGEFVAFVATIYGVAMANLICLPAAGKLKFRHREEQMIKEMALEGVISILEGMNPRMLEEKLLGFLVGEKETASAPEATPV